MALNQPVVTGQSLYSIRRFVCVLSLCACYKNVMLVVRPEMNAVHSYSWHNI